MTSPSTAIDLELWQVRGLLFLASLCAIISGSVVWHLIAWEHSLQKRETLAQIGEAYCLSHTVDLAYEAPRVWLGDARSDEPLWLALDAHLIAACGGRPKPEDLRGDPFTLADGMPVAPGLKPAP
ncbi:MAG: hypothetical protein AAF829_05580 [Pseudomonadota bacterium]